MFTCSGNYGYPSSVMVYVITWNLQTNGVVSAIERQCQTLDADIAPSIAYSMNGKMVGVLRPGFRAPVISVYDVVSGVYMYDINHGLYACVPPPNHLGFNNVWTHGESLRFAAVYPAPITIREVRFTPRDASTQVEAISVPDYTPNTGRSHIEIAQISPASYRVALFYPGAGNEVLVWDTRDSKFLLRHTDVGFPFRATFSSDGRFFACSSEGSEVYLWKEDSAGYKLYGTLASGIQEPIPLLSPDGESIITFGGATVRLWHTKLPSPTPSSTTPQNTEDFVLDFLPDRSAVAVARPNDNVVVILDLESGIPYLTIDTGMMVHGLRVVENVVAVIGNGKIVAWDLPGRNSPPATQMKPEDSAQTITFDDTPIEKVTFASMSPDSHRVAILGRKPGGGEAAYIFDLRTRGSWTFTCSGVGTPWFPPGDEDLWVLQACDTFVPRRLSDIGLPRIHQSYRELYWRPDMDRPESPQTPDVPQGCPWRPSRGYSIGDNGWILRLDEKRLLMLPPSWRSKCIRQVWNGQFLALLHGSLPEPVILDLEPKSVPSL